MSDISALLPRHPTFAELRAEHDSLRMQHLEQAMVLAQAKAADDIEAAAQAFRHGMTLFEQATAVTDLMMRLYGRR